LITKLLDKDPSKRLDITKIKQNAWFVDIDWNEIIEQKVEAKKKPSIANDFSEKQYDVIEPLKSSKKTQIQMKYNQEDFEYPEFG